MTVALLPYSKKLSPKSRASKVHIILWLRGASFHAQLYNKFGVTFCRPMPKLKIVIILIYYLLLRSVPQRCVALRRQHAIAGSLLHQVGTASTFIARLSFDKWISRFSCSVYWDDDVRSLVIAFPLTSNISALCSCVCFFFFFDLLLCAIGTWWLIMLL